MPTVGGKKFPYTAKGKKAAKAYAKKTGKMMMDEKEMSSMKKKMMMKH